MVIGAFSHILWDSFTHETGHFVSVFPYLSTNILLFEQQIPVYKILQHGSTLIGGLIISVSIVTMEKDRKIQSPITVQYWYIVLLIFVSILLLLFSTGLSYKLYGQVVVTAISAISIALICTPPLPYCKKQL